MFTMSNELSGGNAHAWDALVYCIKHNVMVSAEVIEWLCEEQDDLIIDEGYVPFEHASRWAIGKYYIFNFDGEYFRVWESVGLTEMQPNEWFDQTLERVVQKEIKTTEWFNEEQEEKFNG